MFASAVPVARRGLLRPFGLTERFIVKKLCAALAVACAALGSLAVYQELPNAAPSKPIYVDRVIQLLEASNAGQWKQACDAAPTAAYTLNDFYSAALGAGVTDIHQLAAFCVSMMKYALTKQDGKTPVGSDWKILWWTPEDVAGEKLVVVRLHWHSNVPASTVVFHLAKWRLEWATKKPARCGETKEPCAVLRWFVLGAT